MAGLPKGLISEGAQVTEFLDQAGWFAYALVFVAAAVPVIEILVVIPAGIAVGLAPLPVAVIALAGNTATVALVVVAGDRLLGGWRRRRERRRATRRGAEPPTTDAATVEPVDAAMAAEEVPQRSRAARRAQRILQRWGIPGLALLAPISTGSHVAAIAALAVGASRQRVLAWMTGGLVAWAVPFTIGSALGVDLFRS